MTCCRDERPDGAQGGIGHDPVGRGDGVLRLLGGLLLDVHGHGHDVGGLLDRGRLDEVRGQQDLGHVLGCRVLDGDGRGDGVGRLADGDLLDELRLRERLGDLDGGGHLDLLRQLDGVLGLHLHPQLLADEGERVGRDHGLHQGASAGVGDGIPEVGRPVVLDDQDARRAAGGDGLGELLEPVDAEAGIPLGDRHRSQLGTLEGTLDATTGLETDEAARDGAQALAARSRTGRSGASSC